MGTYAPGTYAHRTIAPTSPMTMLELYREQGIALCIGVPLPPLSYAVRAIHERILIDYNCLLNVYALMLIISRSLIMDDVDHRGGAPPPPAAPWPRARALGRAAVSELIKINDQEPSPGRAAVINRKPLTSQNGGGIRWDAIRRPWPDWLTS